jgi:hypothetical protein
MDRESGTVSYSYQWKRGGVAISGATSSSYLLVTADLAAMISVTVTATNVAGSANATAAAVGPVTAAAANSITASTGAFAFAGKSATLTLTPAAGGYTGPGEITGWGTAYGYWGLRAYNASKIGANCIDVCPNFSGASGTITTLVIGSDGYVNISGVTLPIYIDKIYDQAGTQHLTLDAGGRPSLVASIVGGKPAMQFPEGFPMRSAANATALAQPNTVGIICRSHTFGSNGMIICDGTFNWAPFIQGAVNTMSQTFNGSVIANYSGVADNTLVSLTTVANGTPSTLCINGATPVSTGAAVGTNGIGTTNKLCIGGTEGGGVLYNGYIFEVIIKAGAVSAADQTALSTNQHAIGTGWT